jgi:hypothetical protein
MFFLNLSVGEFLGLLGALGGLVTALYFLDRTRRKKVVSTLRFWTPAHSAEQQQSRRRVNDPWSLMLQLLGLLLLLLAAAELEWGARARLGRDHVLLLDTSAWSGDAAAGARGSVLDREKVLAGQYLAAIPANDRVMVVWADGLTTPVTPFTANRAELRKALAEATSGFSALNLEQALSFATQAQTWSNGRRGEIVYVGARMVGDEMNNFSKPANLRVLTVEANRENAGIRSLSVKRGEHEANSWQASVTLKNYSASSRPVLLQTQFAGTQFSPRTLVLKPREETAVVYDFITHSSGSLIARIETGDSLASDNRAALQLPRSGPFRITVFTDRPETLRPLFAANWRLDVKYLRPDEYASASNAAKANADLVVIDRFAPSAEPQAASLWLLPIKGASPVTVKKLLNDVPITDWHGETALGEGLHAKEARLRNAEIFETVEGDTAVASVAAGPVVVARAATASRPKMAVVGFDPLSPELKYEITTPLLFANLLHWLSPESFRTLELSAASVGGASVTLDPSEHVEHIRVTDAQGTPIPFTVRSHALQFFASRPTIAHIVSDDRERVLSLTLPDVAEKEWSPTEVTRDLPPISGFLPNTVDLWKWLALAGALCLLAEWILFGQQRSFRFGKKAATGRGAAGSPSAAPQPGSKPKMMAS